MYFRKINIIPILATLVIGCTEPFDPQTSDGFESALVVDASITNELKKQQILLSRAFELDKSGPDAERNANVRVVDDSGFEINFQETVPGTYVSTSAIAAEPGRTYQLLITTNNGQSYTSESARLPNSTQLDGLYAERITTDLDEEGVAIFVNSFDPENTSKYYLYEYEETYKIIAPRWNSDNLILTQAGYQVVPREREEWVCYNTDLSTDIIIYSTNGLFEDRVDRFPVRFINRDNYILSYRYGILVRQYIISAEAYSYYETLARFSDSESLLSETQPGFIPANIRSNENGSEKVLGYFDVSSVDSKRVFFNYEDLFPGERLPPYVSTCIERAPDPMALPNLVINDNVRYIRPNDNPMPGEGPYFIVPRVCGDCTLLGNTEVPEFWIEE